MMNKEERKALVTSVVPLIYKKVHKYTKGWKNTVLTDELVTEATFAAIEAANTWDESKGKFTTYVNRPIDWAISVFFKRKTHKGDRVESAGIENGEEVISWLTSSERPLDEQVFIERAIEALQNVPHKHRAAIELWMNAEHSKSKEHEKLGITPQAFHQRIRKGVSIIHKQLNIEI